MFSVPNVTLSVAAQLYFVFETFSLYFWSHSCPDPDQLKPGPGPGPGPVLVLV